MNNTDNIIIIFFISFIIYGVLDIAPITDRNQFIFILS